MATADLNRPGGAKAKPQQHVKVDDLDLRTSKADRTASKHKDDCACAEITYEVIAAKAYELWQMRGGDAEFNWHEAEQMLREQHQR